MWLEKYICDHPDPNLKKDLLLLISVLERHFFDRKEGEKRSICFYLLCSRLHNGKIDLWDKEIASYLGVAVDQENVWESKDKGNMDSS